VPGEPARNREFGVFRCDLGLRRRNWVVFSEILLKNGAHERIAGQDVWISLSAEAQTPDGDSHRPGCGSRDFREELP
jgi:hypothetical protein